MERDEKWQKVARVTDDCFASVIRDFMASPKWKGDNWSDATKELWGRYLKFAGRPNCLGAIARTEIRPALVQAYIDGLSGRPGVQAATMCALKQLEKWAIVRDTLPRPITTGVEIEESDGGHTPWSDEQVALVEKNARADFSRIVTLGANTGQRGSDLIRMGWSDIEHYNDMDGIKVVQKKTGRQVWVPITDHLAAVMKSWEKQPGPFCKKLDGHPWTREQLTSAWDRQKESNPAIEEIKRAGLVLHGLRGHACVRLLRAGANTRQISDMIGMSEPMVKNYTKLSDQRENATAAVYHLKRTDQERPFNKSRQKAG